MKSNLDKIYIWYDAEGDYLEVDFGEPQRRRYRIKRRIDSVHMKCWTMTIT